jgi:hypothetical protein
MTPYPITIDTASVLDHRAALAAYVRHQLLRRARSCQLCPAMAIDAARRIGCPRRRCAHIDEVA